MPIRIQSDLPAREVLDGFSEDTILHSGPPIDYEHMCALHKRGMISGVLLEYLTYSGSEP